MLVSLTACSPEKPSYMYLMLHPAYLQNSYNRCVEQVADPGFPCETIMRAQADFTSLSNQREQDPERFGAHVLQEQENTVYLKKHLEAAWQAYLQVGQARHSLEELKQMRIELDKREADYRASDRRVKILLSVIAATSNV